MWRETFLRVGAGSAVLLGLIFVLAGGCKKSTPTDQAAKSSPDSPVPSSLARIHWLGKKRIAAETNSVGFMKIWNLPESAKLEAQTLDKLALALANTNQSRITNHQSPITNYASRITGPSALLRPRLERL